MSKKRYTVKIGKVTISGVSYVKNQVLPDSVSATTIENLLGKNYVEELETTTPIIAPGITVEKKVVKADKEEVKTKAKKSTTKKQEVDEDKEVEQHTGLDISPEDLTK